MSNRRSKEETFELFKQNKITTTIVSECAPEPLAEFFQTLNIEVGYENEGFTNFNGGDYDYSENITYEGFDYRVWGSMFAGTFCIGREGY